MKNALALSLVVVGLTGCAMQSPAPLFKGFYQKTERAESRERKALTPRTYSNTKTVAKAVTRTTPAVRHTVKQGEWLYKIARDYKITPQELLKLNNMSRTSQLEPGDVIIVKAASETTSVSQNSGSRFTNRITGTKRSNLKATAQGKRENSLKSIKVRKTEEVVTFTTHLVGKGETLYRIGKKYNVSPFDLMAANDFVKPQDLKSGMKIQVPMTRRVAKNDFTSPIIREDLRRAKGMIWPAEGRVIKTFGKKASGIENTGINIAIDSGAPIFAVDDAKVIYADQGLKKYGNLVLLRHKSGVITAYAHASALRVKRGQKVAKGQVIALAGQSGNVDKPQLHFEVRRNARAINPLKVLPKRKRG